MKQQLAWSRAYVLYYTVPCSAKALTPFAPESCGRTDGPNPIQVMLVLCHIWQTHAECQFLPSRVITTALLPNSRKKENAGIKELLLLFIPSSSLLCGPASHYLPCLRPSAAAQLRQAGL